MASNKNQESFSRLSLFLKSIREKQSDIILVIGVILIALIGFGLGQLTAPGQKCQPLIIEDRGYDQFTAEGAQKLNSQPQMPEGTASLMGGLINSSLRDATNSPQAGQKGVFVASKNSNKYHWPWCSFAQKIKPLNQVWFSSEAEAQTAGYTRCSKFLELTPANYKP